MLKEQDDDDRGRIVDITRRTRAAVQAVGAGPLSRSSFDHVHVSRSSATTSIEKSRHEPTPPYPPMMKLFFSASPSSSSANSTRVAVRCERGCGAPFSLPR